MYDKKKLKENALPAIASLLCPGLGQAYGCRWFAAVFAFIVVIVGYAFFFPIGFGAHIWNVADAFLYHAKIK